MSVVARERASVPVASAPPEPLVLEPSRRQRRGRVAAVLGVLMSLCALLSAQRLRTRYWLDEALTVGIAQHSVASIPTVLLKDGSPPLYYFVLAMWTRLFGTSEVATHSLSLLFAVATVPIAFWAAGRLFDRRAAWFTAMFASLTPFVTYFAGETRMYSMVVVESMLLCVAFSAAFIEQRPRGEWWFAVALAALLYTHYWGFYAAGGALLACIYLIVSTDDRRPLVRAASIGFGGAAVAFLPWLPTFVQQLSSTGAPWSHTPTLRGIVGELAALVRDERVLGVVVLVAGAGLTPLARDIVRRRPVSTARNALAIACIGAAPVALGWLLAHLEPSWATRYLAVTVGPMILLVGAGLSRVRWLGVVALTVIALLVTQPFTRISPGIGIGRNSKSNAGSVAELVAPELPSGSVVLVSQPEAVPLFAHYLGDGLRYADPRGPVSDPTVMDWRDAEAAMSRATVPGSLSGIVSELRSGDRVLLVSPASPRRDTDTPWIERFRMLDQQWQDYVHGQTCLRPLLRAAPAGASDTPYRATLYECR